MYTQLHFPYIVIMFVIVLLPQSVGPAQDDPRAVGGENQKLVAGAQVHAQVWDRLIDNYVNRVYLTKASITTNGSLNTLKNNHICDVYAFTEGLNDKGKHTKVLKKCVLGKA